MSSLQMRSSMTPSAERQCSRTNSNLPISVLFLKREDVAISHNIFSFLSNYILATNIHLYLFIYTLWTLKNAINNSYINFRIVFQNRFCYTNFEIVSSPKFQNRFSYTNFQIVFAGEISESFLLCKFWSRFFPEKWESFFSADFWDRFFCWVVVDNPCLDTFCQSCDNLWHK